MGIGEVGETLRRSTVVVRSERSGSGSGVIWDSTGAVVTNAHVVHSDDLTVEFWDGRTSRARLERRDIRRDLAVLRVGASRLHPACLADSHRVRIGELVIAVGNPLGFTGALSTGVVHGVGPVRGFGGLEFVQTTVRLAPGNSGGPLADAHGNVVGINTAVVPGGLGLAVPSAAVHRLLNEGSPPELGVTVRPVRIPGPDGGIALSVVRVVPGGSADYASLRAGDLIVGADGRRLVAVDDLRDAVDRGGRFVRIQFLREGDRDYNRKREVTLRLIRGIAA